MVLSSKGREFLSNLEGVQSQIGLCERLREERDRLSLQLASAESRGLYPGRIQSLKLKLVTHEANLKDALHELQRRRDVYEQGPRFLARKRNNGQL